MARGVQHHFNNPFHVPIRGFEPSDVHAKTARDRGTDLFRVQLFPLDFTALEHVLGEGAEDSFLAQLETKFSMRPSSRPCSWRTVASRSAKLSRFQRNRGQSS